LEATATGTGATDVNGDGTPDPVSVPCENAAPVTFSIVAGVNPAIPLAMACDVPSADPTTGSAQVNASFTFTQDEACGLTSMFVGPLSRPLMGVIDTSGAGTSNVTAYAWSQASVAPGTGAGTFANPNAADTTFICTTAGAVDLTLTVTNVAEDCTDFHTVRVECTTPFQCGNNDQEPGEECDGTDTPAGRECLANCQLVECGDGAQQGSEQCDDGNTTAGDGCGPTCLDEFCGDGIVNNGEQCDPPGATVPGGVCSATCTLPMQLTCDECTANACAAQVTACGAAANNGVIAAGNVMGNRCQAAIDCMETAVAPGDYCVTLDGDTDTLSCACPVGMDALTCASQDPTYLTGPQYACLPILRRAAVPPADGNGQPPASMSTLMFNFVDPETAVGDVMALTNCQITNCQASCAHLQP
jgi:cysteine-rich repeat protein